MGENSRAVTLALTRRSFLEVIGAAGAALTLAVGALWAKAVRAGGRSGPVVSFYMDRLYLDRSGTAAPYHPPPGARSAQIAMRLSEEMLRRKFLHV